MTWNKNKKEMEKALAAVMRLLVLIRESLMLQKAEDTPLFSAVESHANMCGTLIPEKFRMTTQEIETLRAALNKATTTPLEQASLTAEEISRRLQSNGNVVVLKPNSKGGFGV